MRVEEIEEKLIYGVSTRTKNIDEMNPKTSKIGEIWQKFYQTVKCEEKVYGIYFNYESDANGEFDVLAGCEIFNEDLSSVKIKKGKYLVFNKLYEENNHDAKVQAVIETWGQIWEYFSNEDSKYKRAYKTDFEYYKNQNEIEIFISIQ